MTVLVIGGGIAGLTAARRLTASGCRVSIVDQGRRPGGRLATRHVLNGDADRPEHASLSFDHGAQYFTARDPRFAAAVEEWLKARIVQVWSGKLAAFDSEGRDAVDDGVARWVGIPNMTSVGRHLARDLDLKHGLRVTALEHGSGTAGDSGPRWTARTADGLTLGPFDAAIVALPAPQALPLVSASATITAAVSRVRMHPCWATLVAFAERVLTPFDGAFVTGSPLGWIARDRSKPRRELAETWVLHATAGWSTAHVDDSADAVGPFLLNAFADLVRAPLPRPVYLSAHRWRYACADPALNLGAIVDPSMRLAVCGDWCAGNRVEGAYLSGLAASERIEQLR